jgi:hypothetical protein
MGGLRKYNYLPMATRGWVEGVQLPTYGYPLSNLPVSINGSGPRPRTNLALRWGSLWTKKMRRGFQFKYIASKDLRIKFAGDVTQNAFQALLRTSRFSFTSSFALFRTQA